MNTKNATLSNRLISLDVLRGLIMIFLAAESYQLYFSLNALSFPGVAAQAHGRVALASQALAGEASAGQASPR